MTRFIAYATTLAMLGALAACQKKRDKGATWVQDAGVAAEPAVIAPEPLPIVSTNAPIGKAIEVALVAADDDGRWQVLCEEPRTANQHLQVVVGGGPGVRATQLHAAAAQDLLVTVDRDLHHLDLVAHTTTRLPRASTGAIDEASRRVVVAVEDHLMVRDPGRPPRDVPVGGGIAGVVLRGARWAEVTIAETLDARYEWACADVRAQPRAGTPKLIDLDPTGAEATDTVGPEVGISATGEITLAGEVVMPAECVGLVVAALTTPPRLLVSCADDKYYLAQPGAAPTKVGYSYGSAQQSASIWEHLTIGARIVCVSGGCIDLIDGRWFDTLGDSALVIHTAARVVRKAPTGLIIDDVVRGTTATVALPRLTQEVRVDLVTGRRRTSAPPTTAPAAIDVSGNILLYGRFVIDLEAGKLLATLAEDALAVDRTGRALVPAAPGMGPLRWVKP